MTSPFRFLEGSVVLRDRGLCAFSSLPELLAFLYVPPGTVSNLERVRLCGVSGEGQAFNVLLGFEGIEHLQKASAPQARVAPAPAPASAPEPAQVSRRPRIGEILVALGAVTEAQVAEALAEQRLGGGRERLGAILLRKKYVTPKSLYQALSKQLKPEA